MYTKYADHYFKRSATILANPSNDLTYVNHLSLRYRAVAKGYVDDSLSNRTEISIEILESQSSYKWVSIESE